MDNISCCEKPEVYRFIVDVLQQYFSLP